MSIAFFFFDSQQYLYLAIKRHNTILEASSALQCWIHVSRILYDLLATEQCVSKEARNTADRDIGTRKLA
jgi:hypothetical protein